MELNCKRCGLRIPAEDISLEQLVAKCRACDAVFGFADEVQKDRFKARAQVPLPSRMKVHSRGSKLSISWRWWSLKYVGLALFSVVWCGFLVLWYSIALDSRGSLFFLLFPLLHVIVGVAISYTAIAGFFNSTWVEVDHRELSVWHGPVPWPGHARMRVGDIEQLYVTERRRKSDSHVLLTYDLQAVSRSGRQIPLLKGLEEVGQGLYLEQLIEGRLGIVDRPVPGEISRN